MDITFTVKITEEGIPQLMGLLAKMWDNPNPAAQVSVQSTPEAKVVTVSHETPTPIPPTAPQEAAPTVPAAAPAPAPVAQVAPVTTAQIQAAAGVFMDTAPGNMKVLQDLLAEQGVQALPQLSPDQLQAFAARLREHGVAI